MRVSITSRPLVSQSRPVGNLIYFKQCEIYITNVMPTLLSSFSIYISVNLRCKEAILFARSIKHDLSKAYGIIKGQVIFLLQNQNQERNSKIRLEVIIFISWRPACASFKKCSVSLAALASYHCFKMVLNERWARTFTHSPYLAAYFFFSLYIKIWRIFF